MLFCKISRTDARTRSPLLGLLLEPKTILNLNIVQIQQCQAPSNAKLDCWRWRLTVCCRKLLGEGMDRDCVWVSCLSQKDTKIFNKCKCINMDPFVHNLFRGNKGNGNKVYLYYIQCMWAWLFIIVFYFIYNVHKCPWLPFDINDQLRNWSNKSRNINIILTFWLQNIQRPNELIFILQY